LKGVNEKDPAMADEPLVAEFDVGAPNNVDPHKLGDDDRPQEDWGEPATEAVHSANHTRRPDKTEAARGQGRKTLSRNKDIVRGGLYK
jgi:hypothetical protein